MDAATFNSFMWVIRDYKVLECFNLVLFSGGNKMSFEVFLRIYNSKCFIWFFFKSPIVKLEVSLSLENRVKSKESIFFLRYWLEGKSKTLGSPFQKTKVGIKFTDFSSKITNEEDFVLVLRLYQLKLLADWRRVFFFH